MKVVIQNRGWLLLLLVLFAGVRLLPAQSSLGGFEKFEDSRLRFHAKYLTVKPSSDKAYGGLTFNFSWNTRNAGQWESRFLWEQTLLSDWAGGFFANLIAGRDVTQPASKSGLDHSFSTGLFGSFQWGLNVVATDRLVIAPCVSFGDYIFAVQRFDELNQLTPQEQNLISINSDPLKVYRDPAGYFFVAGPAIAASFIPFDNYWIDAFLVYDLTAYNVGERNIQNFLWVEGYPNPHFVSGGVTINHHKGLFLGTRFYALVNRGSTDTGALRLDFNFGFNL